ncbi:MAG TPA: GAF domain-containing protein [Candidatus Limnocylindrales bacterium]|nr:GAF domain-containing protein [Candidatus Limnocylindrales bacterium]
MTIGSPVRPTAARQRRASGYVAAIAAVALIAVLRLAAEPVLGDRALFLPFVLAVAVAAWIGGAGPAVLAIVLGAAGAVAIGVDQRSIAAELQRDIVALVLFVLVSAVVTLLTVQLVADRERARRNEIRATQLGRVSNAVSRGLPPDEVARVVLREGLESLGAGGGVVGVTSPDGSTVSVIASSGYQEARIDSFRTFAVSDQLPMSEAIRLREPIVVSTAAELRARYPSLAGTIGDGGSGVVLPLLFEEQPIGALYFRFDEVRTFDADDRAYFLTLGRQCASALVRARLADAERTATAGLSFLVRAGGQLNASLDVDEIIRRACELVVPELADGCAVHLLEPDGSIRLAEVAHVDVERAQLATAANQARPQLEDERGVGAVIRTGAVEHVAYLSPDAATRALAALGWPVAATDLPPNAYAIVPLVARGRVLGSVSLMTDTSGRQIGPSERQLADQLAERAAMAIDNGRLYRELAAREARRSAIARLGQQAIGVGAGPESLATAAAKELVTAVREVDEAAILELVDDGIRIAGVSAGAGSAFTGLPAADDPLVARTLAEGGPIVSDRAVLARIATSAGPWGLIVVGGASDDWPIEALESVAEVAAVLGEAIDRVRRLEEERRAQEIGRAFIGVVSHELRTPITTIYAGAKLLRRAGADERERRDIAGDIEAEADRLYRLTEDLLVLTRLERNDLEIGREPVLVSRLAERVVASERAHWPLVEFRLRLPAMLPTAVGEDNYVEQVLRNLIGNAGKYSPTGSTVDIEAATTADGEVVVRVLDRGPGVSAGDRDRLFSLFYRSPATASQASGAGIGLFVCEQLVRAMGGRLWAEPRPDGGSEFGFALQPYLDVDDESPVAGRVAVTNPR